MRLLLLVSACCTSVFGCAAERRESFRSELSGAWEAVEGARDKLVIQPDGTFDFTTTMLAMAGDVSRLRKTGDYIERPQDGVRIEITESEFAPTVSYIRVKCTHRMPEKGAGDTAWQQFHASLGPDGHLVVRSGVLAFADAPRDSVSARLYRRVGDAPPIRKPPPPPKETKDEWITLGRRQFAGENWFEQLRVMRLSRGTLNSVLMMPRDAEASRRFLLVRLEGVDEDHIEDAIGSGAAAAVKVGCSILSITIPELDVYGEPDATRVAELAQQVLAETRKAVEVLRPNKCGLETSGNATYVGHYLWQKDDATYDGWLCWDATHFTWYGGPLTTNRDRPALVVVYPFSKEDQVRRHGAIVAKYHGNGFNAVRLSEIESLVPNWDQQSIRLLADAIGVSGMD